MKQLIHLDDGCLAGSEGVLDLGSVVQPVPQPIDPAQPHGAPGRTREQPLAAMASQRSWPQPPKHGVGNWAGYPQGALGAFWAHAGWQSVANRVLACPSGSYKGSGMPRSRWNAGLSISTRATRWPFPWHPELPLLATSPVTQKALHEAVGRDLRDLSSADHAASRGLAQPVSTPAPSHRPRSPSTGKAAWSWIWRRRPSTDPSEGWRTGRRTRPGVR